MESPKKNNDCYFYYYSTCSKGDNCTFRHEPSALGCETVCSFWKEGKCVNVRCNFRHMELRKNRKAIQCYWETQPGGCLKPHCPFLHQNPKAQSPDNNQGEASDLKASQDLNKSQETNSMKSNDMNYASPVVDSLVVNFEEESDNESVPTCSPIKAKRMVKVKTLEEIKLERIQAQAAAYYSYNDDAHMEVSSLQDDIADSRKFLHKNVDLVQEMRKRRWGDPDDRNKDVASKKQKHNKTDNTDISDIKIKTLAEIREERAARLLEQSTIQRSSSAEDVKGYEMGESEDSSRNSEDCGTGNDQNFVEGFNENSERKEERRSNISKKPILKRTRINITEIPAQGGEHAFKVAPVDNIQMESDRNNVTCETIANDAISATEERLLESEGNLEKLDVSKIDEGFLLEEDDSENANISVDAEEEDIFKDIDELLNE